MKKILLITVIISIIFFSFLQIFNKENKLVNLSKNFTITEQIPDIKIEDEEMKEEENPFDCSIEKEEDKTSEWKENCHFNLDVNFEGSDFETN